MKAKLMFESLADLLPFKKKSSLDWVMPASIGLSVGVAAGVGLGVLIAPSSGEHTRRRLRDRADRMRERARLAAEKAKGQISEQAGESPAI